MPTLGGLLKKRRTKDSHTLSKELESSSSPAAAQTQTSPNSADHDHHYQHYDQTHHHQHSASSNPSNNSATPSAAQPHRSSNDNPNRSSGTDQKSEGQTASMQFAVTQPHPSTHHNPRLHHLQQQQQQPQQQSHTSRLHNILHPSHHASSQASTEGHAHSQQANQTEARTTKGKYSLDDFTIQRTLGTGSFGRVHLVQSKHNHRFYAIKVLKKAQVVKMKQVEHTNDERRMLNRVRHPFLITLWGTWQDARNLYMVMDFVEGGELFSLLRKSQVSALRVHINASFGRLMSWTRCSGSQTLSPSFMRPR